MEQVADRRPGGSETILLVEDDASVRNPIKRILSRQGYTVLEARDGADALQVLGDATRTVDLVMTDLMMPGMGGLELIPELLALSRPPRIVLMSGHAGPAVTEGVSLPPSTRFLEKPFTLENLLQTVRAALDAPSGSAA